MSASVAQISRRPSVCRRRSSGVASLAVRATSDETLPSSVARPIATTTPSPLPRVTAVPPWSMLLRSATGACASTASTDLSTGTDSPVSVDSSACRLAASITRRSALIRSPPSNTTMSPGTRPSAGIRATLPPRRTRASTSTSLCSASIERVPRSSTKNPMAALIAITTRIATPSTVWPSANASAAAAASSSIIRLANWSARMRSALLRSICCRRFAPWMRWRRATSASASPSAATTSSDSTTRSAGAAHGCSSGTGCAVRCAVRCAVTCVNPPGLVAAPRLIATRRLQLAV